LSGVFRDFGIQDGNWTRDAIDWIGDAIQGIGYHTGFEKKIKCVEVQGHIGCLPCDLERLIGVSYRDCKLPLGADVSGYGIVDWKRSSNSSQIESPSEVNLSKLLTLYEEQKAAYDAAPVTPTSIREAIQVQIDRTLLKITDAIQSNKPSISKSSQYPDYYNVDLDVIKTSFSEGEVNLLYIGFKLDENGFPMVRDEFNYKQAVKFYILWMLISSGYKHHTYSADDAMKLWEMYRYRAKNQAKHVTLDGQDRFMKMWTRYRFDQTFSGNFFIGAEDKTFSE
jgi:hypothetical protein